MDLKEVGSMENRHPWELSRSDCIYSVIKNLNFQTVADIGSGDRYFTKQLLKKNPEKIYAVDSGYNEGWIDEYGILCVKSIFEIPNVDCIVMMDVLEHIENDSNFLEIVYKKLNENGVLLITVPAMQYLWSGHDEYLEHYRRYDRKQLLTIISNNNFQIEKCHYFYTSLYISLFCILKILKKEYKETKEDAGFGNWEYSPNNILTKIIKTILDIDFYINKVLDKMRLHLPGLSIVAVCRKV